MNRYGRGEEANDDVYGEKNVVICICPNEKILHFPLKLYLADVDLCHFN